MGFLIQRLGKLKRTLATSLNFCGTMHTMFSSWPQSRRSLTVISQERLKLAAARLSHLQSPNFLFILLVRYRAIVRLVKSWKLLRAVRSPKKRTCSCPTTPATRKIRKARPLNASFDVVSPTGAKALYIIRIKVLRAALCTTKPQMDQMRGVSVVRLGPISITILNY